MSKMEPAERVEAVLKGELVDKVPFTVYECMIPQCTTERVLRNQGLCVINRHYSCYTVKYPDCTSTTRQYEEKGKSFSQTVIKTPVGDITTLREYQDSTSFTSWQKEFPFKSPEDYKPIKFWIENAEFSPDYDTFLKAKKLLGNDIFLRGNAGGYSPLQYIIYSIMGVECFSIEWLERRDEIMKLYDALTAQRRKLYPILAKSPALAFNYGGNVSPEIVGKERFEKYILPHYDEVAEILHKNGKLLGVHFDANTKLLKEGIAKSKIDYIEAFTPFPDCDMSVAEAREAWPDKVLWINFPSSVHISSESTIEETTKKLLYEVSPGDRFIIGITEDVPENRWQKNFCIISQAIEKYGRLPIKL